MDLVVDVSFGWGLHPLHGSGRVWTCTHSMMGRFSRQKSRERAEAEAVSPFMTYPKIMPYSLHLFIEEVPKSYFRSQEEEKLILPVVRHKDLKLPVGLRILL